MMSASSPAMSPKVSRAHGLAEPTTYRPSLMVLRNSTEQHPPKPCCAKASHTRWQPAHRGSARHLNRFDRAYRSCARAADGLPALSRSDGNPDGTDGRRQRHPAVQHGADVGRSGRPAKGCPHLLSAWPPFESCRSFCLRPPSTGLHTEMDCPRVERSQRDLKKLGDDHDRPLPGSLAWTNLLLRSQ